MIKTEYKFDGKELSYEILEDGYLIYLDGQKWIKQDSYLPYKKETLEESCIAHIEAIVVKEQEEINKNIDLENQLAALQAQLDVLSEAVDFLAMGN